MQKTHSIFHIVCRMVMAALFLGGDYHHMLLGLFLDQDQTGMGECHWLFPSPCGRGNCHDI